MAGKRGENGQNSDAPERPRLGAGLWTLIRMLPRMSVPMTIVLALSVLVAGVTPVATRITVGVLVGAVPGAVANGWSSSQGDRLLTALVVMGSLYALALIVEQISGTVAALLGHRLHGDLRERVMRAAMAPEGVAHLEDPEQVAAVSLARNVAPGMYQPSTAVVGLAVGLSQRLAVLVAVIVVTTYVWGLGLALAVVVVVAQLHLFRLFFAATGVITGKQVDLARAVYFRDLALTPAAVKETRIFGLRSWIIDRYTGAWLGVMRPAWAERRDGWRTVAWATLLLGGGELAAYAWVGWAGASGHLTLETTSVLVATIALALGTPISDRDLQAAYGAAAIPAVLALEASVSAPAHRRPALGDGPTEGIRLEGVSFAYAGADREVLSDLSLSIPAGQRLAVVGVNGAGKTTLIKLLAGLYQPSRGRIEVDGVDLAEVDARSWRRRLAVLFQDYVRYELPARDNVGFGAPQFVGEAERLDRAARRAGAADLINDLGQGWDTVLSRQRSEGADLSGGQWQRVALARALLAVDAGARVLILDEPTANLDVRAEAEVYNWLLDLAGSATLDGGHALTTILISHRFSTVRRADRIVVVEHGRIVEDGSHAELMAANSRYAAMFGAQASRFAEDGDIDQLEPTDA